MRKWVAVSTEECCELAPLKILQLHVFNIFPSFVLLSSGQKKICGEKSFGPKTDYYRDTDLHIGSYIRVFDRDLLLHDVDEFTRNYYRTKYGYSEDMLAAIDVQVCHQKNSQAPT